MPPPRNLMLLDVDNENEKQIDKCVVRVIMCLFLIFNINIIIFAIQNLEKCPIDIRIPIFLLVSGILNMLTDLLCQFPTGRSNPKILTVLIVFSLFLQIAWLSTGSAWVYDIYKPNFTEGTDPYCDETVYWLTFWLITVSWILIGLIFLLVCYGMCLEIMNAQPEPSDVTPTV